MIFRRLVSTLRYNNRLHCLSLPSELNPELMEELKMLRSEYTRLKEFESKREVDSVVQLEKSCDDAKMMTYRFKEKFFQTKSQLEDTQRLLTESEAREATLKSQVEELSKKCKDLAEEMKAEQRRLKKAALEAEQQHQKDKMDILQKSRQDLLDLEQKLNLQLEAERKRHHVKMERVEDQQAKIEKDMSEQIAELREHSSKALRTAKEEHLNKMDELERNNQAKIEALDKAKAEEIEALINKGKGMVRDERRKNKDLEKQIEEQYQTKIESLEEQADMLKDGLSKAIAKVTKRDERLQALEGSIRELNNLKGELESKVKKAEMKTREHAQEAERLRRQLVSRFGPGGASQTQLEELHSVCKSLQEENRRLKANNTDRQLLSADASRPEQNACLSDPREVASSFSKTTLNEFRDEYKEKIADLEDEKRNLIMKLSAASTEIQKAGMRSCELEEVYKEELSKVKSELVTAKLALQRNERRNEFPSSLSASTKKRYENHNQKENTPNQTLPPSGRRDFAPKSFEPTKNKSAQKSLMELTQTKSEAGDSEGQNPECAQS